MNQKRALWSVFALLLALSAVAGFSGSPALSLGWYGGDACDDAAAQNPGDPAGCRYGARERSCADGVDNDSDERADSADMDCQPSGPVCRIEASPNAGQDGECLAGVMPSHCADGADNDGDGYGDCSDPDCAGIGSCAACVPSGAEDCAAAGDEDCDGAADASDSDCAGLCSNSWWAFWMPRCVEVCDNGIDDDADGLSDCADRADCAGQPSCQTGCSGVEYCNPGCPEYAGYCACNPSDPLCGTGGTCTPESVCMQNCPAYDACACDPTAPSCGGCDGTMTCNPKCPEFNPLDATCCDGAQVCNPVCAEYSFCLCNPSDPSCDGGFACGNGKDDDGDGLVDEKKIEDPKEPECPYESETNCFDEIDNDEDGLTDCADIEFCSGRGRVEEAYTEVKELVTYCSGGTSNSNIESSLGHCRDGEDNDGNGYVDCEDSACHQEGSPCLGEGSYENGCDNHKDDDVDGKVDCDDSDCQDSLEDLCAGVNNETSCVDNVDNDGDGKTDCADDECFGVVDYVTSRPVNEWTSSACGCGPNGGQVCNLYQDPGRCFDGSDNDRDGDADRRDGDCTQFLDPEPENCRNGLDDDQDGETDCRDSSCYFDPRCVEDACNDAYDNDGDGKADCEDFDCQGTPECN